MEKTEKKILELLRANEVRQNKSVPPLREACFVKNFLHIAPNYIVRRCLLPDDYSIDPVWPEVLFMMDLDDATRLKVKLEHAWRSLHPQSASLPSPTPDCGSVKPICIYRVDEYSDEAFYRYVHRVPASLRNLKKLEKETGIRAVGNIVEV